MADVLRCYLCKCELETLDEARTQCCSDCRYDPDDGEFDYEYTSEEEHGRG